MKVGNFSLEVVASETGRTFTEHNSTVGGLVTYAEVEPEIEYYVQVSSSLATVAKPVYVDLEIDGQKVETGRKVLPGQVAKMGAWQESAGGDSYVQKALKFGRATVHERGSLSTAPQFWTGVITARFYGDGSLLSSSDGKENGLPENSTAATIYRPRQNLVHLFKSGDVGWCEGVSTDKKEKGVKTVRGETVMTSFKKQPPKLQPVAKKKAKNPTKPKKNKPVAREAELLCTISLHYCSTVGLIRAGILRPPPIAMNRNAVAAASVASQSKTATGSTTSSDHKFTQMKEVTTDANGNVIRVICKDFCDLTNDSDED